MSTERKSGIERVELTTYYGGDRNGPMIRVRQEQPYYLKASILEFTKEEARALGQRLLDFADGKELERAD